MKKKILAIITFVIVIMIAANQYFGISFLPSYGSKIPADYKEITSIPGVHFYIPPYAARATAINNISNTTTYDRTLTYSYKDGEKCYALFNMSSIAILVQKGTTFSFQGLENKEDGLDKSPIINTWFEKLDTKFKYTESSGNDVYRFSANVNAGVTITTELFGDFIGTLVCITKDGEEYSLFIGAPNDVYTANKSEIDKTINTVVESFSLYTPPIEQVNTEIVDVTGVKQDQDPTIIAQEIEIDVSQTGEDGDDEKPTNDKEDEQPISKAMHSNIYYALEIGQKGVTTGINRTGGNVSTVVDTKTIQRGKETSDMIQSFNAENDRYLSIEAPSGTHWESVTYILPKDQDVFIDVKLKGMDGEQLFFRGVGYPHRTYSLGSKEVEEGIEHSVFYAVPNGCVEYMLIFGESDPVKASNIDGAYYKVTGGNGR